jgi:CRP-like cAMP-binding protein
VPSISEVLRRTRLAELGLGDAISVAEIVRLRRVRAGHVVYGLGDRGRHAASLFVVQAGRISLHLVGRGARRVEVALVESGDLFGSAAPDPAPLREVAVAESDARLLEIPDGMIQHVRRQQPELAYRLACAAARAATLRYRAALLPGVREAAIVSDAPPSERGEPGRLG